MSVRSRLTAWYVIVTAVFLVAFGAATYALLLRTLQQRMDASLAATQQSFQHAVRTELAQHPSLPVEAVIGEEAAEVAPDRSIAVFREDGTMVIGSPFLRGARRFTTLGQGDAALRALAAPMTVAGKTFTVVVARRLDEQTEFLEGVRASLLIGIPLWTVTAGLIGYLLVRKTLRPVFEMSEQQRRFMADASHELRTPVAVVRGEAEVALSKESRGADELRESLVVIEQESRLLSSIIEDLFLLARADAGQAVLAPTRFYLDELIADAVHSLRSLAAKKSIAIGTSLAPESAIEADERLVRRMLVNLLDNAVKYSPEHGRVHVSLSRDGDAFVIDVADTAPSIAPEHRQRIFERFYRGASSGEGAGLGLPIAQSIARLHGGRIEVRSAAEGNVFRVTITA